MFTHTTFVGDKHKIHDMARTWALDYGSLWFAYESLHFYTRFVVSKMRVCFKHIVIVKKKKSIYQKAKQLGTREGV